MSIWSGSSLPAAPVAEQLTTALGTGFSGAELSRDWSAIWTASMRLLDPGAQGVDRTSPIICCELPLTYYDVMNRLFLANPKRTSDLYELRLPDFGWTPKPSFQRLLRSLVPVVRSEFLRGKPADWEPRSIVESDAAVYDGCLLAHKMLENKRRRGYRWVIVSCSVTGQTSTLLLRPEDADLMARPFYAVGDVPWKAPSKEQEVAAAQAAEAAKAERVRAARAQRKLNARQRAMRARLDAAVETADSAEFKAEVDLLVSAIRDARLDGTLEEAMDRARLTKAKYPDVKHATLEAADECPICLEDMDAGADVRVLVCGHKGCASCMDRWMLASGRQAACPLCRGKM
jgi:hypothetical protein